MDRRIEKTYNDLQASMRTLLGNTTWDKITIQEICSVAMISRSTFYKHFTDKEDLLDSLLDQFETAMTGIENGRSLQQSRTLRYLPILIQHVSENRHLFAKTNMEVEGYPVAIRFRAMIQKLTQHEFDFYYKTKTGESTKINFIAGGIYQALIFWSDTSEDSTHLPLLRTLDAQVDALLSA